MNYLLVRKRKLDRGSDWRLLRETVESQDLGDPLLTILRGLREELNYKMKKFKNLQWLYNFERNVEDRYSVNMTKLNTVEVYAVEIGCDTSLRPDYKEIIELDWFYPALAKKTLTMGFDRDSISRFEGKLRSGEIRVPESYRARFLTSQTNLNLK